MQVGSAQGVKFNTQDPVKVKIAVQSTENSPTSKSDGISMSKIAVNTLKGAGVGVAAGALGGAGVTAVMFAPLVKQGGEAVGLGILGMATTGIVGAVIGGTTGAIVANVTKNKIAGAIGGAVAGGVASGLINPSYAIAGAVSGGLAGYFAAKVAK